MDASVEKDKNTSAYPNEMLTFIAGIFPNAKYFDARFDLLQVQIDEIKKNQELDRYQIRDFKADVDRRFSESDAKFEQVNKRIGEFKNDVDKRFEQVDKRFEQVDKRFEQMIASIDKLGDKLEYRDKDQRSFTLRMFSIAVAISILGVLGAFFKILGLF